MFPRLLAHMRPIILPTLEKALGFVFTDEIKLSWNKVFAFIIGIMVETSRNCCDATTERTNNESVLDIDEISDQLTDKIGQITHKSWRDRLLDCHGSGDGLVLQRFTGFKDQNSQFFQQIRHEIAGFKVSEVHWFDRLWRNWGADTSIIMCSLRTTNIWRKHGLICSKGRWRWNSRPRLKSVIISLSLSHAISHPILEIFGQSNEMDLSSTYVYIPGQLIPTKLCNYSLVNARFRSAYWTIHQHSLLNWDVVLLIEQYTVRNSCISNFIVTVRNSVRKY